MDYDNAPDPYELARIAAALLGREAAENPKKAAQAALELWIASDSEILNAMQRSEDEARATTIFRLSLDESGKSEAMEWMNTNLRGKFAKNKFDDFKQFKTAWCKFNPSDKARFKKKGKKGDPHGITLPVTTDLDTLMVFRDTLETHREDILGDDAERNRNKRKAPKVAQNPSN